MEEKLRKLHSASRTVKIVFWALIVLALALFIIISAADNSDLILVFLPVFAGALVCGYIYLFKFRNFNRCMKWLAQRNYPDVSGDINLENPTLPKSKVYCGSKALFFGKTALLIPYAEIAWIYQYKVSVNLIPVVNYIVICTRDGESFMAKAKIEELNRLLSDCLLRQYPDIMVGYSAENKKRYDALYRKRK